MIEVPSGSIYFWCYEQGLKGVPWQEVKDSCLAANVPIREKDETNYWNGWYRHDMYHSTRNVLEFDDRRKVDRPYETMRYSDYPTHPYLGQPDPSNRWVPCNKDGRPLYKWGNGCKEKADAECMRGCKNLAENLKGCQFIVIDCDGDHDKGQLDLETIRFLSRYIPFTHTLAKPKCVKDYETLPFGYEDLVFMPASFHLTFKVDRVISTMHFPEAHIDIIGNEHNSLRYLKNKIWNEVEPAMMNDEIWESIKQYVLERKRVCQ